MWINRLAESCERRLINGDCSLGKGPETKVIVSSLESGCIAVFLPEGMGRVWEGPALPVNPTGAHALVGRAGILDLLGYLGYIKT